MQWYYIDELGPTSNTAWRAVRSVDVDSELRKVLPTDSDSGRWLSCRPILKWRPPVIEVRTLVDRKDLLLASSYRSFVSDRVRQAIQEHVPGEFQFLPVHLECRGATYEGDPYWLVNPVRTIDCLDGTLGGVNRGNHDDASTQVRFDKWVLRAPLIPADLKCCCVRFVTPACIFMRTDLRAAIMRLSPIGVFWKRLELSQNPRDPVRESLSLPIVLEPVPQFPAFPYIPLTDTEKARIRVEYEQREAEKAVAHSFLLPFIGKAALQRVEVGPPATRDQIEELEALTAHRLPRLYSDFLRTCGCLQAEGCEVFGTPPRRTPTYGALRCTRDRQQQQDMAWPKHLLVIGEDGRGGDYCLDLSKSDGQDCPVVYHDHELDNFENPSGISTPSIEIKSPSFEKWLKRVVRGQM